MTTPDGLTEAADALYALLPGEFVAARNERSKQARADGDKTLAEAVKALTRPTTAAWVVNQLVRHEPGQTGQVLALGESLRAASAQLAGDELRDLNRQRRRLTAAVTTQARGLAADLGVHVGDAVAQQVEETLHAAMVDEGAAAAVRSGLLVRPLAAAGLGTVELDGALAYPEAAGRQPAPGRRLRPGLSVVPDDTRAQEDAARAVAAAELEVAEAAEAADEVRHRLTRARERVAELEARSLQLQAELDELRRKAAETEHRLEGTDSELEEAEEERDLAAEEYDEAAGAASEARARLSRLGGGSG